MTIEELLAATGLTANDLVPIYDAEAAQSVEPTQKITAAQFAAAVKVLADLQGKLTFDSTPTTGSTNPVTSGGVATAIAQSTAVVDLVGGYTYTPGANVTIRGVNILKSGQSVFVTVYFDTSAQISNNGTIMTFSKSLPTPISLYVISAVRSITGTDGMISIEKNDITKIKSWGPLPSGTYYYASFMYLTNT